MFTSLLLQPSTAFDCPLNEVETTNFGLLWILLTSVASFLDLNLPDPYYHAQPYYRFLKLSWNFSLLLSLSFWILFTCCSFYLEHIFVHSHILPTPRCTHTKYLLFPASSYVSFRSQLSFKSHLSAFSWATCNITCIVISYLTAPLDSN